MATDREQKIRDVYEAMHPLRVGGGMLGETGQERLIKMARAAVDVLDPVKRIELSGGFHAEPGKTLGHLHDVYSPPGETQTRHHVGQLSKMAVEAWWNATEGAKDVENLRKANDELKQRIATLGRIIEATKPVPLKVDVDRIMRE